MNEFDNSIKLHWTLGESLQVILDMNHMTVNKKSDWEDLFSSEDDTWINILKTFESFPDCKRRQLVSPLDETVTTCSRWCDGDGLSCELFIKISGVRFWGHLRFKRRNQLAERERERDC